jgi:hypothetical protein
LGEEVHVLGEPITQKEEDENSVEKIISFMGVSLPPKLYPEHCRLVQAGPGGAASAVDKE